MRVWLLNSSEPTPVDEGRFRLRRMGILTKVLLERGHTILWWNSAFFHATKRSRYNSDTMCKVASGFELYFLHAPAYRKNISLRRLRNHAVLGRKFRRLARNEPLPDIILSSYPTIEFCYEAVNYGRQHHLPTVLDVRDLWPDMFLDLVPRYLRQPARLALGSYFRMGRTALAGATAILGNTQEFVDWGLRHAGRQATDWDRCFPFGYLPPELTSKQSVDASRYWQSLGIVSDPQTPVLCFFGAISRQFDFDTVLKAAHMVQARKRVKFVFCGDGEMATRLRHATNKNPDILFPGWVDAPKIWALMQLSSFGLAPYIVSDNFLKNVANKPIEYLAGGLPILCSLPRGALYTLVVENNCGCVYSGDARILARVILENLTNPFQRQILAENACRLYRAKYEASRVYGSMVSHLESLVATAAQHYRPARAA